VRRGSPRWTAAALGALLGVATVRARAQERPKEEDIFGAPKKTTEEPKKDEKQAEKQAEKKDEKKADEPAPPEPPTPGTGPATRGGSEGAAAHAPPAADARDQLNLGERDAAPRLSTEAAPDNPLTIGGQFYLQSRSSALEHQDAQNWTFATPAILDGYFDARPNNRVRGFVLGRMFFDPTLPPGVSTSTTAGAAIQPSGATSGVTPLNALTVGPTRGPTMVLDQLWLRFDLKHTVFVTAGRQHVRWGTARFWTPADFLHIRRRNPLDVFDARVGTSMLKVHVPWESRGWNFYGYALTEGLDATPTVADVAGAGRAEVVLGTSEAGIGAVVQRHRKPKLAADFSAGIWDIDVYGEAALRYGSEIDRVGFDPSVTLDPSAFASQADLLARLSARYPVYRESGIKPQVTGGLSYQRQYADKDFFILGGEYFYNGLGYSDSTVYPGLILPRPLAEPASFFYLGRHYAAVYLSLPAPYSWDLHSFTLSTLGNLSDRSFISRFDYALTLLTHLTFEAFVAVHYGRETGEFRFGIPEIGRAPGRLDLGVALRVKI
jgi:hypothetical protein